MTIREVLTLWRNRWGGASVLHDRAVWVLVGRLRVSVDIGHGLGLLDGDGRGWRRRGSLAARDLRLSLQEFLDGGGHSGQMHGCILAGKYRGWLIQVVGQTDDCLRVVSTRPVGVACLGSGQDASRKGKGGSGEDGWPGGDELLVEEGNLGDVESHVLNFGIVWGF